MGFTTEILIILGLVLLNGFFAGAEIAILTAKPGRLSQKAKQGSGGARLALDLARNASRFLSTVQVGITVVATLAAAYSGAQVVTLVADRLAEAPWRWLADHRQTWALAIVTAALASVSLVLGELVPKRLALQGAELIASLVAYPMYALSIVARPIVILLGGVTSAIVSVFGWFGFRASQQSNVTVEDIQHLIEAGREEGVLDATEREIALEALQLGERRVRDIMRPRVDIEAVDIETPSEEVVGTVAMSGFSRLPVYEESLDRIVGFVYIKDVFQQSYLRRKIDVRKIMRPPLFVPDTLTVDRLLARFQSERTQLAIVLDEFGGTEGMVTVEDVIEELVGKIHDEYRHEGDQMIVQRDESSWLVDGRSTLDDLVEEVGESIAEVQRPPHISTVSGLIVSKLQRLPQVGETVQWDGISLEVVDMDGPRIDRVLITIPKPNGSAANDVPKPKE